MAAPERELISLREYARRRGVSHAAVSHAIKRGRITTVSGRIDPTVANREWPENTDPSKPRNSVTGRPRRRAGKGALPEPMQLDPPVRGTAEVAADEPSMAAGYSKARAARELYQAQLAKLELELKRGQLVRADEVRLGAFTMARKARDLLIAVPERLAAVLAAESDVAAVQRLLEDEVERICEEIAGD